MNDMINSVSAGQTVRPTELARSAGVSPSTARKFLRERNLKIGVTAGPVGLSVATYDGFLADLQKLGARKKYAGITIHITEK